MADEQDEIRILRARMRDVGITEADYEIKGRVVYWLGVQLGGIPYLNSRPMDMFQGLLEHMKQHFLLANISQDSQREEDTING